MPLLLHVIIIANLFMRVGKETCPHVGDMHVTEKHSVAWFSHASKMAGNFVAKYVQKFGIYALLNQFQQEDRPSPVDHMQRKLLAV